MKRKNKFELLKERVREERQQLHDTSTVNPLLHNPFYNFLQRHEFGKETYDKKKKNTHR
tara:strand:- start:1073 stop:1249 length:177 start_codon:yes stop_codon:yes gene_type:complete